MASTSPPVSATPVIGEERSPSRGCRQRFASICWRRSGEALRTNQRRASAEFFTTQQGERYFLFTEFGDLIIAKLTPGGYEEIDKANLLPPTTWAFGRDVLWCAPAFAGKCMFARNDKELLCISLAAEAK